MTCAGAGYSVSAPGQRLSATWPGASKYDWSVADETFNDLHRRNLLPSVDLCHGGGPDWVGNFQNPDFPKLFAQYTGGFARRFPWVQLYTPVNEMHVCAEFSGLYGWWNEQLATDQAFVTVLKYLVKGNASLEQLSDDDWARILTVDLRGSFYFIEQGFLHMKPGGAIVNVASIHAVATEARVPPYAAAKAAVVSLTRSAAIEGKPKGLRVNAVLPGAVNTPMLWNNPNVKSGVEKINPADVGQPDDLAAAIAYLAAAIAYLAAAIAYLAADDAKFVQGAELRVDGGRLDHL